MAIIQFNSIGLPKDSRNLQAGPTLHTRCIANLRELCAAVATGGTGFVVALGHNGECKPPGPHMCLLSDYGCHIAGVARRLAHAANTFLAELFALRPLGFGASAGALR
ncbi:F-box protein-like [Oryza sativa Japonica Group]|uniref:F-box protein-like n=1 Tax=Oryza sativa subsp. japonica TaxID=39947 RepID=Q5JM23_ORYSJ|nr:F-box protein-like [Oryza sativa Japonica Group]